MERSSAAIALVGLGFATAVAQAALLREAMAALGGSELAWGAVLALWLLGMGLGAWVGVRLRSRGCPYLLPLGAPLLGLAGVVLLRAAPRLLGAVSGETVSTWQAAWVWVLAVLPVAVLGGLAFPLLASSLAGDDAAGRAYALEGAGALVGGVAFTFLLAPSGSAGALVLAAGVVVSLCALGRGRHLLATAFAVAGIVAVRPAAQWLEVHGWGWSGHTAELEAWDETREQRLELAGGRQRALYADGRLVATYPDPYRTVPRAHLLLLLHPHPRKVLAVGLLADTTLPALLEHPVDRLLVAEEDARLASLAPDWLDGALPAAVRDPRVEVRTGDPLRVVASLDRSWDLILLLDGDPSTMRRNRTRTVSFFAACGRRLAPGGLLVVRTSVSDTYLGGMAGRLLATLASSLKEALPEIRAVPGAEVLLVAGRAGSFEGFGAQKLKERWSERHIADPWFTPAMLDLLLDAGRTPQLQAFVDAAAAAPNTVAHPRAVLAAAMLAEARGGPPLVRFGLAVERLPAGLLWAVLALGGAALVTRGARGRAIGVHTAMVVGFAGMGWWLLLLAAWQSTVGSVYAQVGALSAAFMAGLVIGASLGRRWTAKARFRLAGVLTVGIGVSLLIVAGAPLDAPRLTVVPLLLLGGFLTGAAFPLVAELSGAGDAACRAGRSFAADEVGAGLGAVAVGLVALPWVGVGATGLAIVAVQAAAVATLLLGGRTARRGSR
jgi:spermidine synthase